MEQPWPERFGVQPGQRGARSSRGTSQPADQDTDNSAVPGSYSGVYDDGTTKTVTATASDPVGYCLVLTTDGNGKP